LDSHSVCYLNHFHGALRPLPSSFFQPGAACRRSRLPGWLRLTITFGILFTLKYGLPMLGAGAAAQVVVVIAVATGLAWYFWWNCSPDRRGVATLIALLWVAGVVKLLRL
jgi:hypothetical protein